MTCLQLDQVQQHMRQSSRRVEQLSAVENSQRAEIAALTDSLRHTNDEWALTQKQLKAATLDAKRASNEVATLTAKLEQQHREKSDLFQQPGSPRAVDLTHAESKTFLQQNEIDNLQQQIKVSI